MTETSESEKERLYEQWLNEDFRRDRLIRLGYLSVAERQRLREKYGDLDQRFEPEPEINITTAVKIFLVFVLGMAIGLAGIGIEGPWEVWVKIILGSFAYFGMIFPVFKDRERAEQQRTTRYWEWRGYKCDKYGRKIGSAN
jgi:hypothetical protein